MHELLDKVIPSIALAMGGVGMAFLRRLGDSIVELNLKMAIFVEKITAIAEHVDDHENRLRDIEAGNPRVR